MYTLRQLDIITYLLNHADGVTSEQLSAELELNRKTIRAEIRLISELLGDECQIEVSQHGYCMKYLSEQVREQLREEVRYFGGKNSLGNRPSSIVLYLLFLKDYVTMQELADTFYMSKTAIALEMETVKRWISRYEGIELEVSTVRGIKIHATEMRKRIYCINFGTVNAFRSTPLQEEIKMEYERDLSAVRRIMQKILVQEKYLITGEEFWRNSRFIACSILRSRMGYPALEFNENSMQDSEQLDNYEEEFRIANTMAEMIEESLGYLLSETELFSIVRLLNESSVLQRKGGVTDKLRASVRVMNHRICEILSVNPEQNFLNKEDIINHLAKEELRIRHDNIAANHINEEIVLRYPLEAHLIYRLYPECLGWEVNKEYSHMALFLGAELNVEREGLTVLIVSNHGKSVIQQTEQILLKQSINPVRKVSTVPTYLFEQETDICQDYDVCLTTSREVLLRQTDFILIPPVLFRRDVEALNSCLVKRSEEIWKRKRKVMQQNYCKEMAVGEKKDHLDEVINKCPDEAFSFHTFGRGNLYVGHVVPFVNTGICIYQLKYPIIFCHKKIRRVIFTEFCEGEEGILDFFRLVSELLCEYNGK